MAWWVSGVPKQGLNSHLSAWHKGFPAVGGFLPRLSAHSNSEVLWSSPSLGMQWNVVANGRVSPTPSKFSSGGRTAQWHLGPGAVTLGTAIPPREGRSWSCCPCMTAPGVLFTQRSICWCRHPVPIWLFLQDSSRWQGTGWPPCSLGGSSSEIPPEGILLFPSTPSFWPHSHPCLIVSVVPNIYPYCAWFVLLVFQTG